MRRLRTILRKAVRISVGLPLPEPAAGRAAPTAAMYFSDPLADLISLGVATAGRPIVRLTPTLFACGTAAAVIRYAGAHELALLQRGGYARVFLVLDDHLAALGAGDGLPADYRRRLLSYRDGALARLLPLISDVVAPSVDILRSFAGKRHALLQPASCHDPGSLTHHRTAPSLSVVIAATRSHLADVAAIATEIAGFFEAWPEARLTTFLGQAAPRPLRALHNASHLDPLGFFSYRSFVARNRFHVALAPALPSAFNRARSCSKIHDHAGFGAAGIYASQPPYSGVVGHGTGGWLVAEQSGGWRAALERLASQRRETEAMAAEGQRLSQRLGAPGRVRQFWMEALALPGSSSGREARGLTI